MNEPIIPIHKILRDAYLAAEAGRPESACPYPAGSGAAYRWVTHYRECKTEHLTAA